MTDDCTHDVAALPGEFVSLVRSDDGYQRAQEESVGALRFELGPSTART